MIMHREKSRRQKVIVQILGREIISNQEELREKLEERGLAVTQATLSRDLKELGVVKRATPSGSYQYILSRPVASPILSCLPCESLLVVRTEVGLAPRIAYQIDSLQLDDVMGTVAGEDTLLIMLAKGAEVETVRTDLLEALSRPWSSIVTKV